MKKDPEQSILSEDVITSKELVEVYSEEFGNIILPALTVLIRHVQLTEEEAIFAIDELPEHHRTALKPGHQVNVARTQTSHFEIGRDLVKATREKPYHESDWSERN